MHELEVIEGELIVRATDWLADRRHGTRHVRYGGYLGAPTAELVLTGLGWSGLPGCCSRRVRRCCPRRCRSRRPSGSSSWRKLPERARHYGSRSGPRC